MTSGGNSVEKFKLREMPHGAEYMREIVCRAAAVVPKQTGEQGFYKAWVGDGPMVAE